MVRVMRDADNASNVVVTSPKRVEDLRSGASPSISSKCSLSSSLQSFILATLQRSAEFSEAPVKKSRRQRPRRRIASRSSAEATPTEDYQTQFPALSSTSSKYVASESPLLSYSAMAAFTQPASASMDTVDASSPKSDSIVVPKLARSSSNGLFRAVHTWMSNGDLSRVIPSKAFHRPAPLSKSRSTRTTFDGLFSNNMCPVPCQEINETSKKSHLPAQVAKLAPTAPLVRSSLLKVNKTQLFLPDYLLERLVSTNPAISALIQNQKTAISQRPSRRSSPSSSYPPLPNVSSHDYFIQQ